ncbi:MAG: hypothetical protein HUU60_12100 [Armatimonadetes bacterium]|nr:hypothetical protein [Armatimonadota bacterium]
MTPGSEAEKRLQTASTHGLVAKTRGLSAAEKVVRPAFLRWLLLQPGIDPAGVRIEGAVFKEMLDLANLSIPFPLCLTKCKFRKPVILTDAEFRSLCFDDSTFAGSFSAKGLMLKRDFSAERATFKDYLDLRQARIGGSAMLIGAKLNAKSEVDGLSWIAFLAYAMHVEDNLMMHSDANHRFEAKGEVRLLGAKIGGQWACVGGSFEKGIFAEWLTAESFLCRRDDYGKAPSMKGAILLTSAEIKSRFQWKSVEGEPGLKLDHARIGVLDIEPSQDERMLQKWSLNGLHYDRLENPKEADSGAMLALLRHSDGGQFFPQPYRQLFRALRAAGHSAQATKVMIEMKREQFRDWQEKARWFRKPIVGAAAFLSSLVGHGYRPANAVVIALGLWVVSGIFYWAAAHPDWHQIMAPREAEVRFSSHYREDGAWPSESPRFFPFAYALDRMTPIVELGQVAEFQPKGRTYVQSLGIDVGMWLQILDWFLLISGWILTTLLVSSLTGLMRRVESDE